MVVVAEVLHRAENATRSLSRGPQLDGPPMIPETRTIQQSIAVSWEFPVTFTHGLFDVQNPVLVQTLGRLHEHRRARALVFVDGHVAAARPNLVAEIAAYFSAHTAALELAGEVVGDRAFGNTVVIAQFTAGKDRIIGRVFRAEFVGRELNLGWIVKVPVFFGRNKREVRFHETHGEEEGLGFFAHALERGNGELGDFAVLEIIIRHVRAFEGGATDVFSRGHGIGDGRRGTGNGLGFAFPFGFSSITSTRASTRRCIFR